MPVMKKKINLTIDHQTYLLLDKLSQKKQQKLSTLSLDLIHQALELQEDFYFSKVADRRLSQKKQKRIPHKKAWRNVSS